MNVIAEITGSTAPFGVVLLYLFFHLLTGLSLWRGKERLPLLWRHFLKDGEFLARRLNRPGRGAAELRARGAAIMIVLAGLGLAIGAGADWLADRLPFGFVFQALLLVSCVSAMTTVKRLARAAAHKGPDTAAVFRHAIEEAAMRLNTHLLAPVFFYCLWEAKGLVLYTAVGALHQAFGSGKDFGVTVRSAEKILNFVPARLSVFLLALSAVFVSKSSPLCALKTAFAQGAGHPDGNSGRILAAMAGALGIVLGGPSHDYAESAPWLGPRDATAKTALEDVGRARMLAFVFFICVMFIILASLVARLKFT